MQSDNQHIDDFFRAKEQAFIPDASHIQTHWQQLKAMQVKQLLQDFYTQLDKEEQLFTVQAEQDEVVVGKEGTRLRIPPYCFQNKNGFVEGPVQIHLQEFYTYTDMIAGRLSTRSNDRQLVSDGMVHLKATADGETLWVAPETTILVSMPALRFDDRMMLFTGVLEDIIPAHINWIAAGQQQSTKPALQPTYVKQYRSYVMKYLNAAELKWLNTEQIQKMRELLISWRNMNKLQQAQQGDDMGQGPLHELPSDNDWNNVLNEVGRRWASRFMTVYKVPRQTYRFNINSLGWINCDRHMDYKGDGIEIRIPLEQGLDAPPILPQLVFMRYHSIAYGEVNNDSILFRNIPENEPAHIVITAVKEGKVVCCMQPLATGTEEIKELAFAPVTVDQFQQQLTALFSQI
jgi:hypothetical protein